MLHISIVEIALMKEFFEARGEKTKNGSSMCFHNFNIGINKYWTFIRKYFWLKKTLTLLILIKTIWHRFEVDEKTRLDLNGEATSFILITFKKWERSISSKSLGTIICKNLYTQFDLERLPKNRKKISSLWFVDFNGAWENVIAMRIVRV